jgi:hypothetical protein
LEEALNLSSDRLLDDDDDDDDCTNMESELKVKPKVRKFHGVISKSEIVRCLPELNGTPVIIVRSKCHFF